jgi:hypothetical protein
MHLPWLAQQYERTCADCGHAWRVPRYFARSRVPSLNVFFLSLGNSPRAGGGGGSTRQNSIARSSQARKSTSKRNPSASARSAAQSIIRSARSGPEPPNLSGSRTGLPALTWFLRGPARIR